MDLYISNTYLLQLSAIFLSLIASYFLLRWYYKYPNRNIIYGYPIIGSAFTEFTVYNFFDTIVKYSKTHGPIYDIFIFNRRITILCDPEDIKEVLFKRPKIFKRPTSPTSNPIFEKIGMLFV